MLGDKSRTGSSSLPSVGHAAGPDGSRRDTEGGHYARSYTCSRRGRQVPSVAAGLPCRVRRRRFVRHRGARGDRVGRRVAPRSPVTQLVVLADDKKLQNTDNVVPAINTKASTPQLIAALDKVSDGAGHREADRAQQGGRHRPQDVQGGGRRSSRRPTTSPRASSAVRAATSSSARPTSARTRRSASSTTSR